MARKITAEDFQNVQLVSDPQMSPDGKAIALVKKHTDVAKNKYRSEIWVVPTDGGEPRRFTAGGDHNSSTPRWSPDGKTLAFLSDRQKPKSQIFLIPADGGEAQTLTKLDKEGGISAIRWSPDGTKIAFLFRETPDGYREAQVKERTEKELPPPPRVHKRLFYRLDAFGYFDNSYDQVWVADAKTGEAHHLTSGDYACSDLAWSPDNQTLAFLSDRREDGDIAGPNTDIYTVPVAGGELTLIPSPPGPKSGLTWSPDGNSFAYLGNPDVHDTWGTNNERVFVLPAAGGTEARDLTGHTDKTADYYTLSDVHEAGVGDKLQWNADGSALFFPVSEFGDTRLCFVGVQGGDPVPVSPAGHEMGGFSITPDGRAAVILGSPTQPHELFVLYAPTESNPSVRVEQRTCFNQAWLDEVQIVAPEPLDIPNDSGGKVPGWLIRPADFDPARKYPLVLYVHGGPHMQYGNILFHELQFLAAEGYVVLYTNPRGSKGYGEAHTRAIIGDWGNADFRDVMAATDYATRLEFVDADRTAIMGGSYGGFMTAWAVGHTDRFTCAITDRLVGNMHSMSGTSDFPWLHGDYYKGNAWDDPSDLWRGSPLAYAGKIKTPLLIVHSDGDLRCPVGQAEELFTALRMQRKPVEFVRYPAETSHGMSRNGPPNLRLDRLRRNLEWLDRYLKK